MSSTTANMVEDALRGIAQGDRLLLARTLTAAGKQALDIPKPSNRPPCFGITGAPGAGKSTLINAILIELRKRDRKIGVLSVDPSHPVTGGALLGDRIRMSEHSRDPNVFIRSLGSRGSGTGVSPNLESMINIMSHFPFDVLLVETVGVGQLDIAIVPLTDKVIMVTTPGCGDDIQALKASNLDIADVIVINKADLPKHLVRRHEDALRLRAEIVPGADVPVFKTIASTGEGVDSLVDKFILNQP